MEFKFIRLVPILGVLTALLWAFVAYGATTGLEGTSTAGSRVTSPSADSQESIIIDHTCTDLTQIPEYWLEKAKQLAIHYGHTSHGLQVIKGLSALETWDAQYAYSVFFAGGEPPSSLDCEDGSLCILDGNPPYDDYIEPEDYWSTEAGQSRTRAVADTGLFSYSMWAWCGQQSTNPTSTVQFYLDTLDMFELEYPAMRFIFMTGHTDGGTETLERNNDMVRDFVQANGKVLYDFADIESYDPDGNYYPDTNESCTWCDDWCATHPEDCDFLPDDTEWCPHSHPFNCLLKGRAFWWMMARLAGWEGVTDEPDFSLSRKSALPGIGVYGDAITYTVEVRNQGALLTETVVLTDMVPAGLEYVPGSLTATAGTVDDWDAPTLTWTGVLSTTSVATVTYVAEVTASSRQVITNTAELLVTWGDSANPTLYNLQAAIITNPLQLWLPLVLR